RDNILFADDGLPTGTAPPDVFQRFDRLAASAPPGSGRLIFLPWLNGERTPVDDSALRGGVFNQSLKTTPAHMVGVVLEGVAYNARWLLVYVEKFVHRRCDAITMIGGGAKSDLWCQIVADVLDRTIKQVEDPVLANARGAALLAGLALGDLKVE